MCLKKTLSGTGQEKLPAVGFRIMLFMYWVYDLFFNSEKRIQSHLRAAGITEGMTLVDYGCGPGRYTMYMSKLVGETGTVFACDIHDMAMDKVREKIRKHGLKNVKAVLVSGYSCPVDDHCADVICALDMFHFIKDTKSFLGELRRIVKHEGLLVISEGHQPRDEARQKILDSGCWSIIAEDDEVMKCRPADF